MSEKRRSPSASLFASATGGWGTAEIGSSSNGFVHVPCGAPRVSEVTWVAAALASRSPRQIERVRRRARPNAFSSGYRRRKTGEHDRAIRDNPKPRRLFDAVACHPDLSWSALVVISKFGRHRAVASLPPSR